MQIGKSRGSNALRATLFNESSAPAFDMKSSRLKGIKGHVHTGSCCHPQPKPMNEAIFCTFIGQDGTSPPPPPLSELILSTEITPATTGAVDLVLRKNEVDHGDHQHAVWKAGLVTAIVKDQVQWTLGQDEEGCPCCVAGLDFDEFAVAIKSLSHNNSSSAEGLLALPDMKDSGHWGVFLGVAAPLGLIGLTAALRNIKGSMNTQQILNVLIRGLGQDIQYRQLQLQRGDLPQQESAASQVQVIQRLQAFRDCLAYSKFDAQFNVCFPGVVNGVASALVLSTAILSHPLALPAIALYATGQLARNSVDLGRTWSRALPITAQDTIQSIQAKTKINQVNNSKIKFYCANSLGFATFVAGALLTFLAIPAVGAAGIGLGVLPIGLALLSLGAGSTGVMNNFWPRKFRPRNGDLGIDRLLIANSQECLDAVNQRRQQKKILAHFGEGVLSSHRWQKRGLKVLTALPQPVDFLPKSAAATLEQALPFFKYVGTAATERKHKLNKAIVGEAYANPEAQQALHSRRLTALAMLKPGAQQHETIPVPNTQDQMLQRSWDALTELNLQAPVLDIFMQEEFGSQSTPAAPSQCCGGPSAQLDLMAGVKPRSESEYTFSFKHFLEKATLADKQKMSMSMDFYLYFVNRKQMQYQQYGLIDYFWSMKKYESISKSAYTQCV